jgi:circadian clock protein KaiB
MPIACYGGFMDKRSDLDSIKGKLEAAAREKGNQRYVLRLYVAGITPRSQEAIRTVTAICNEHLAGRYDLQVIDIYQQPVLAKGEQIIAVPTLIRKLPEPLRKIIGSMADKDKLLVGLDLVQKDAQSR